MSLSSRVQIHISRSFLTLALFALGLLIAWSLVVPIDEAPDEGEHWNYAVYLHVNRSLPALDCSENIQPPLYYALVAPFAVPTQLPAPLWWFDDQAQLHLPSTPRYFQNSNSDLVRYWPVRIARLLSAFLSALAVVFIYWSGVEATGQDTTAVLAGSLAAFLPQFTFRGMNVSNESLLVLACSIVTYCFVRMIRRGFSPRLGILTAIFIALAFLSKNNALFLLGPFVLILVGMPGSRKERLKRLSLLLITLVILLPWLARNQVLYGDPVAATAIANRCLPIPTSGYVPKPITDPWLYTVFPAMMGKSFVGMFGWMNVPLPGWIYAMFVILAGIATAGCAWGCLQNRIDRRFGLILTAVFALNLLEAFVFNLTFSQAQGRFLFPSLPALALLAAFGIESLSRGSARITRILPVSLFLLNAFVLLAIVFPVYWPAPQEYLIAPDVNIPPKVPAGELATNMEFSQSFRSRCSGLSRVQLFLGVTDPTNTPPIFYRLIDSESKEMLYEKKITVSEIQDRAWSTFDFPPVTHSAGREYLISLVSPDDRPGSAITVYRSQLDRYEEGTAFINGEAIPSDLAFRYFCSY